MIILATKLMLPRWTRGLLSRERLNQLVAGVREHRVTLVKAPTGYGKTTLARSWADDLTSVGGRVAWLSLDSADDQPSRFAFYVAATIHRACPAAGQASLELLSTTTSSAPETIVSLLLNDVAELNETVFLFIDDFQYLESPPAQEVLAFLLRNAPPNLHLILLGRLAPPRLLDNAIVRDELFEVDANTLRFSLDETHELVTRSETSKTSHSDHIRLLHTVADGWPAALRVLLLSLKHHENPSDYLKHMAATSRPIAILIGDLLDQLPGALTDFMARISLTDRICASLAGAMTNAPDAREHLAFIEAQQLFLTSLEENGPWYAFHPLFREYLERRLHRQLAPEVQSLHGRAADWFAQRNLWRSAVRHALTAQDINRALGWIEACAMQLVESGDMLTLLTWERQLLQHDVALPLQLRMALAWAHGLAMDRDESRRLLKQVEATLDQQPALDPDGRLRWQCRALHAMLLGLDDLPDASGELARGCLEAPHDDGWIRNVLINLVAYGHVRNARWPELYGMPPFRAPPQENDRYLIARAYHSWILAIGEKAQGRLNEARALLLDALKLGGDRFDDDPGQTATTARTVLSALSSCLMGEVMYQQNRLLDAAQHIEGRLAIARIAGSAEFVGSAYGIVARLSAMNGDPHRSRQLLLEAEMLAEYQRWPRLTGSVLLERVCLALQEGHDAEAEAYSVRLGRLSEMADHEPRLAQELADSVAKVQAWLALHRGFAAQVPTLLEVPLRNARRLGLRIVAGHLEALVALALHQGNHPDAAVASMLRACEELAPGQAFRPLLDIPVCKDAMVTIVDLARPQARGPTAAFIERLAGFMRMRPAEADADVDDPSNAPTTRNASLIRKLTTRERQIVRLVAEGGSNKEIGRVLGLAPDTVKYHLKSIFSKLGVDSRTEIAVIVSQQGLAKQRQAS